MGTGDPWLLVQHVAFEGPGAIAGAIADTGADLTVLRMDRNDTLPSPAAMTDVAGLVVMGGPMSVHDDLPWLADERALLRAAVEAGRPVLGVCLGAQQLAAALGASVVAVPVVAVLPVEPPLELWLVEGCPCTSPVWAPAMPGHAIATALTHSVKKPARMFTSPFVGRVSRPSPANCRPG